MEPIKINELIDRCILFFKDNCYTSNVIYQYKSLWDNGIIKYMSEQGTDWYTTGIGKAFKETTIFDRTADPQEREKIRSIQILDDMLLLGKIRRGSLPPLIVTLDGEIGKAMEKLIAHLASFSQRQRALEKYRLYLFKLLNHLTNNGIEHLDRISEEHIQSFIKLQSNKSEAVRYLRTLFLFWEEQAIITGGFMELFDSFSPIRNNLIPLRSQEEGNNRLDLIPKGSQLGEKEKAWTIISAILGLKISRIADLTLEEIDWDNNLIRIVQKKTHKTYTLPLLPEMVNNLIKIIYEINHDR